MRFPHAHSIPHLEEYKANRARDVALVSGKYKFMANPAACPGFLLQP
jgi:hypothetical protein